MAKIKTRSSTSPVLITLLAPATSEVTQLAPEAQAYAVGEALPSVGAHCFTDTSGTEDTVIDGAARRSFEIWVPPWALQVRVWAALDASSDLDIDFGAATRQSFNLIGPGPWTAMATFNVSASGSEWQTVTLGGSGGARLTQFAARVVPIAATDLPDPSA